MARVHVIANQKGGVGKTTVTVNLAAVVADTLGGSLDEPAVLGVSTDPQASMLEWAERVGNALPFDFAQCDDDPGSLSKLRQLDQYDHIFVDTPGSLEDEAILQTVLAQADDVIVPLEPEPMAFSPAARSIHRVIAPSGARWRVLLNNWDPRDGDSDLIQTQGYVQAKGWPVFNTVIRHYKLHARASAEGVTVVQYAKNRVALEARQDFFKLALEVLASIFHDLGGGDRFVARWPVLVVIVFVGYDNVTAARAVSPGPRAGRSSWVGVDGPDAGFSLVAAGW